MDELAGQVCADSIGEPAARIHAIGNRAESTTRCRKHEIPEVDATGRRHSEATPGGKDQFALLLIVRSGTSFPS